MCKLSKIICVTDRTLCRDFERQLALIAQAGADGIILREKDLSEQEYEQLASRLKSICGGRLILHSFADAALRLGAGSIHLPLNILRSAEPGLKEHFEHIGASVHSAAEAVQAVELGADCLIAGHIFDTDCKRGLPGRGLEYLKDVCGAADVPVFAIGGITPENAGSCIAAGAAGVCVMSGLMKADDPAAVIKAFRDAMSG